MAIGEAGSITTNSPTENAPITVNFSTTLDDPVIVLTATNDGGHQFVLRVTEVTDNSFTFIMEEWEYLDGAHPATETINWIAVNEGVHTLPDGRVIEAGTASATHNSGSATLNGDFNDTPVVLTSVMSENDTTTVDSDPLNITTSGFDLRLQEEEAQDGTHAAETVGYIAIEPGGDADSGTAAAVGGVNHTVHTIGLGDTFNNAVVVGETQTINGPNPATVVIDAQDNDSVDLFVEEEQSNDDEMNHIDETIGVVAFEDGLIPCFTPGAMIDTPYGRRPVETLNAGDFVLTRDHGPCPVRWISNTHLTEADLARNPNDRPIRIAAGAIAPGIPEQDITVSPQHRFLIEGWKAQLLFGQDEVLVPAKSFINDHSVRVQSAQQVEYFHLLLDDHAVVRANGAWTESLHAGELDKAVLSTASRENLFQLFPDLRCHSQNFGPLARPSVSVREGRLVA